MKKILHLIFITIICLFVTRLYSQTGLIENVVSVTGSVISDACYGDVCHGPVTAGMETFEENGKRIYFGKSNGVDNGYYFMTGLKPGKEYKVVLTDNDFLYNEYKVSIPFTSKYQEFSRDILVIPKVKDAKMTFHITPFEPKKSKIRVGVEDYLSEVESLMKFNKEIKFQIMCFPYNDDSEIENFKQTLERCNSLKTYFVSNGINSDMLETFPNVKSDPYNPPPSYKPAKGKRYVGTTYLVVKDFNGLSKK